MAPDTNKDNSAWSGLKQQAGTGALSYEPGAAEKGAQYCATLIGQLLYLKNLAGGAKLDQLDPIGDLSSGNLMASEFSKSGTALLNIFDTHVAILTDMGDTFEAAGKAYLAADHKSAAGFDGLGLQMPAAAPASVGLQLPPPEKAPTDTQVDVKFPDDLKKAQGDATQVKQGVSVYVENSKAMTWEQLYNLGQSLKPDPYATAGGVWKWLADQLESNIGTFSNNVQSLTGSWQSPVAGGAEAAQAAVTSYCAGLAPMLAAMRTTGSLLEYTSRWMVQTRNNMPYTSSASTTYVSSYYIGPGGYPESTGLGGDASYELPWYQGHFNDYYCTPMKDTASTIPVVSGPAPLAPVQKPPVDTSGDKTGGANTGGANTGGANTGGANTGGANTGGANTGGANTGGANTGGANTGGANTGGANTGGANTGGANTGGAKASGAPKIPPIKDESTGANPNGTNPNGTNPNGTNPNGTKPPGTNPTGTNPTGQNPTGTNPTGTNPTGSNPPATSTGASVPQTSSSGSGGTDALSTLASTLSSLVSAASTGVQGLSSLGTALQQVQSAMSTGDIAKLATALGVPQDTVTAALTSLEASPDKLNQLKQLLGLPTDAAPATTTTPVDTTPTTTTTTPTTTTPSGAALPTPATGQVTGPPSFTNLFGGAGLPDVVSGVPGSGLSDGGVVRADIDHGGVVRAGLDHDGVVRQASIATSPVLGAPTETVAAGAEYPEPDFADMLAHTLEASVPVVES
ncbi:hypothetical protein [Nocardia sp. NBC_00511]|uniref:hypothetical protein n=1 Tax=Nocardia sp. NBC_00511 TaxID=2903591 RepID=UPI0030E24827